MLLAGVPLLVEDGEFKLRVVGSTLEGNLDMLRVSTDVVHRELGRASDGKVGIKDVKLVAKDLLGWRIISVIVGLIVLVPLKALSNGVIELWRRSRATDFRLVSQFLFILIQPFTLHDLVHLLRLVLRRVSMKPNFRINRRLLFFFRCITFYLRNISLSFHWLVFLIFSYFLPNYLIIFVFGYKFLINEVHDFCVELPVS